MFSALEIIQPHEVGAAIAHEREVAEYRPTTMILGHTALETDPPGFVRFVSIVSLKPDQAPSRDLWWLPQGGIDGHETPEEAFSRELREEIKKGISWVDPANVKILGAIRYKQNMRKHNSKEPLQKYSLGKLLVAGEAAIETSGKIEPNLAENVAQADLLTSHDLKIRLGVNGIVAPTKKDKAKFSIDAINAVIARYSHPTAA